jgi:ubiquinone/menaquinone biosynthesis C-methylase UbiE
LGKLELNERIDMSMKEEWNKCAKEDAFHYVSSFREEWDDKSFYEWGEIQSQRVIDTFLKARNVEPAALVVLEIGCGAGRMSRALASRVKQVFAYDVSEEYVRIAKEKNSHLDNVTFTVNDGVSFPEIDNESIDFVFSGWTMQHMPTKDIVIKNISEIARVLRKGGSYKIDPVIITHSKSVETLISKAVGSRTVGLCARLLGMDKLVLTTTWRGVRFHEEEMYEILSRNSLTVNTLVEDDGLEHFHGKKAMRKWFCGKKT